MTADELRAWRGTVSRADCAAIVGITADMWRRYEVGHYEIPPWLSVWAVQFSAGEEPIRTPRYLRGATGRGHVPKARRQKREKRDDKAKQEAHMQSEEDRNNMADAGFAPYFTPITKPMSEPPKTALVTPESPQSAPRARDVGHLGKAGWLAARARAVEAWRADPANAVMRMELEAKIEAEHGRLKEAQGAWVEIAKRGALTEAFAQAAGFPALEEWSRTA